MELTEYITDLLTDFDEMGFAPTTLVPDPEAYAIEWRNKITKAFNELTQAHEMLSESYGHLEKTKDELLAERSRLTEENEAWQQRLISQEEKADKAYHDLACEVEDLRAENERLRDTAYRLECEVHRERANTVRKMQDEVNRSPDILDVNGYRMIGVDIVDLIAKRMVEDQNRDTE